MRRHAPGQQWWVVQRRRGVGNASSRRDREDEVAEPAPPAGKLVPFGGADRQARPRVDRGRGGDLDRSGVAAQARREHLQPALLRRPDEVRGEVSGRDLRGRVDVAALGRGQVVVGRTPSLRGSTSSRSQPSRPGPGADEAYRPAGTVGERDLQVDRPPSRYATGAPLAACRTSMRRRPASVDGVDRTRASALLGRPAGDKELGATLREALCRRRSRPPPHDSHERSPGRCSSPRASHHMLEGSTLPVRGARAIRPKWQTMDVQCRMRDSCGPSCDPGGSSSG